MGGCGRPIVIGEPATRDHIVPTALYSKVASEAEFDQPWNWQPMHKECNEAKGSALDEWPRFDCDCHYLQIHGRDLYVHTKDPAGGGRHKLLENVVSDEDARVDARLVAGEGAVKGVGPIFGYWRGKAGYLFPGIARSRVQLFNLTERGTVGLPVPETVQLDDAGRVVGRWGTARSVRRRAGAAGSRTTHPEVDIRPVISPLERNPIRVSTSNRRSSAIRAERKTCPLLGSSSLQKN